MSKLNDKDFRVKLGVSHGDINGISYEIIIKTFMDTRILEMCTPIVYGSSKVASYHRKILNINDFSFNQVRVAEQANPKRPNIVNINNDEIKIDLGMSTDIAGEMAVLSLDMATEDLKKGIIDVLVTAPINKFNIQSSKFSFPGHTEYLATRFNAKDYLMLMISDDIRIGVVTGHVPLKDVSSLLTPELILSKLRVMNKSLIQDFAIPKPRIAVLGLNPHAGDGGVLGNEEQNIIEPTVRKAMDENILAFGPYPADGFFGSENLNKFDGILAMYHDQGMVPFKLMSFKEGVNYTAGLPYVRTSPAHGTAYDITGKDIASCDSFRHAIYLACDIYKNRIMHEEMLANPLKISSKGERDI